MEKNPKQQSSKASNSRIGRRQRVNGKTQKSREGKEDEEEAAAEEEEMELKFMAKQHIAKQHQHYYHQHRMNINSSANIVVYIQFILTSRSSNGIKIKIISDIHRHSTWKSTCLWFVGDRGFE
ncbi:hypothetical protein M8J76_014960 [Diaphorina citri]|nr:hypothetical protein M8J76_014960 [Diaphorina citri]